MPEPADLPLLAGVDGCKGGWAAVIFPLGAPERARLVKVDRFDALLQMEPALSILAVDMPIGLPDHVGPTGRGPEQAVRRLLADRQSSVFSVPSRAAVFCEDYGEACVAALATSEPPKKVSKQCFHLFPKIRELDALMTQDMESRIFEVHPEVAFWRLNGGAPMSLPKKVKSRPNEPGLAQRQALLEAHGIASSFFAEARPSGVGPDDRLDAAANALIATKVLKGQAEPFPRDFERDGKGLRMAIWA